MIRYPHELFSQLPVSESQKIAEKLMSIYYSDKPEILQSIVDRANGNSDLIEVYKDEEFSEVLQKEYSYDIDILSNRINDPLADMLVEEINKYNIQLER